MKIDPQRTFAPRECPSCATVVAGNENRCPICHYEFPARPLAHRLWLAAIRIALALLFLLGALLR